MDDPDFLAWQAAKRFERRASKIKEIQKMKILQKIVLKKMCRDENNLKKRAFRRIRKSNYRFVRFLKQRFWDAGFDEIPLPIIIWSQERIVKPDKLKYLGEIDLWKNASD